jgi:hypothetical protein
MCVHVCVHACACACTLVCVCVCVCVSVCARALTCACFYSPSVSGYISPKDSKHCKNDTSRRYSAGMASCICLRLHHTQVASPALSRLPVLKPETCALFSEFDSQGIDWVMALVSEFDSEGTEWVMPLFSEFYSKEPIGGCRCFSEFYSKEPNGRCSCFSEFDSQGAE